MFVSDNTLKSAKHYFSERLEGEFTSTELKYMWNQLICKRMNWTPTDLLLNNNQRLSESDLLYVRSFVKGLKENKPFQYLLGETSFFGLNISCDSRALIPRPETEELVDWVRDSIDDPRRIVDLCTGSGCIALALKSIFPSAQVIGADLSQDALNLAKENAQRLNLALDFHRQDVLQFESEFIMKMENLDVIVSNPPYIPYLERENMSEHVLNHEPEMALFVDDSDPIVFYKSILNFAELTLRTGGMLFFELHESFGPQVKSLAETKSFGQIEIRKDLQGKTRMLKAQKV